jgi:hypothetical protein
MPSKLQAVVEGEGLHPGLDGCKRADNGLAHRLTGLVWHVGQQAVTGLALDQADDGLLASGADESIALPMADAAARLHAGRAHRNRPAIRNLAAPARP